MKLAIVVNSRIELTDKALKRAVSMLIGASRRSLWAPTRRPNKIGKKHRNKKLLFQTEDGDYMIHDGSRPIAMARRIVLVSRASAAPHRHHRRPTRSLARAH